MENNLNLQHDEMTNKDENENQNMSVSVALVGEGELLCIQLVKWRLSWIKDVTELNECTEWISKWVNERMAEEWVTDWLNP